MVAAATQKTTIARPHDRVSQERRGSWTLPVPTGAYAPLRAWTSPEAWFDAVMDSLRSIDGESARRAAKVAPDTLLRVAYADRKAADQRTGRDVATAHETVAAQLGMSGKTVQRARRLLETLGLAVTVVGGRYLTTAEREAAHRAHGGQQLRAASTRALVMPAWASTTSRGEDPRAVKNVQLPVSPSGEQVSHVPAHSPKRARTRAQEAGAPRRPASTKGVRSRESRRPRTLAVQQLAARLVEQMPWLDRSSRHIGYVCDVIERAGLSERGWTAQQILDRVAAYALDARVRIADPNDQRDPLGYFAWLIQRAIPTGDVAPFEAVAAERRRRIVEGATRAAEEAARRAELAAESAQIEAAIDAMHARFGRPTPRPKHSFTYSHRANR